MAAQEREVSLAEKIIGEKLGMQVLVDYKMMAITEIKQNTQYQRMKERAREKRIARSIKEYGYWPQEVIILNELHEAIDGNHRIYGAKENGIDLIPCSIVTFPNKKLEAKFFTLKNSFNTQLKPIDFWHARYLSDHSYAKLLYTLEADSNSLFFEKIAIKNHDSKNTKFTLAKAIPIINTTVLGYSGPWCLKRDDLLTRKVEEVEYCKVITNTNKFLSLYSAIFGESLSNKAIVNRTETLRAFCRFYHKLEKEKCLKTKNQITRVVGKMKTFIFTSEFLKTDLVGKTIALLSHFNKGKKTQRVDYIIEDT